ncbi:HD domain-containing protein [Dethiothermospora halolimnae]|uniref:HD domain-containing protein n=1 Tax=Dethiothermospora halolimnae TaxID=3114390 RepID=UPI003CCBB88C
MDINVLKEVARELMINRKAHIGREKGFIYYHGERVGKLSLKLREHILGDNSSHDDIMVIASLFHDVAKGIEPHGRYGAVLVKDILKEHCTESEIEKISEIIHYHTLRKQDNNYSEYIKIVQDADVLDHFGSIEIWMNFQYSAYEDKPMYKSLEFYKNEFESHAKKCRDSLNYQVSRKIFDDKIKFVHSFIDRFKVETQGDFYIEI